MKLSDVPPHITEVENHPPVLNQDHVIPRWHLDYYDGPLAGIIEYKGKFLYARHLYYMDRRWWAAWELTPEELQTEQTRHELFEKYVGTHTSYVPDGDGDYRVNHNVKPEGDWRQFYDNKELAKVNFEAVEEREMVGILTNPFRWA
jgi:hypothetical protein